MSRDSMNTLELIDMAIADLQAMRSQVQWLEAMQDGRRRGGGAGFVSTSGPSDPTGRAVVGNVVDDQNTILDNSRSLHEVVSGKLHATHRDLQKFVNERLVTWLDRLQLIDEEPRPSDEQRVDENDGSEAGPARLDGGFSVYRGQRPKDVPGGLRSVREAVAAQERRLDRGEGYGDG